MWPLRAAIRPVPPYAVVPRAVIERMEDAFYQGDDIEEKVDQAFHAMDRAQPALARFVSRAVEDVPDETAQALGHFLGVAVFQSFDAAFGGRVGVVDDGVIERARVTLECDEELRRGEPSETLESDDVIAITQPHLIAFVRGQIDSALEADEDDESDVDIESVESIYRAVLVTVLSLSDAVNPPRGLSSVRGLA